MSEMRIFRYENPTIDQDILILKSDGDILRKSFRPEMASIPDYQGWKPFSMGARIPKDYPLNQSALHAFWEKL